MGDNMLRSVTMKDDTGCGSLYTIIVYNEDDSVNKIFANLGKSGTCASAFLSSYCSLLTSFTKLATPKEVLMSLIESSGQTCQYGSNSCIDVLNRLILNEIGGLDV